MVDANQVNSKDSLATAIGVGDMSIIVMICSLITNDLQVRILS